MRIAIVALIIVVAFFGAWHLTYPSATDPKNMRYVFWKAGLCRMDLNAATNTMIGDSSRDKIVLGKTRQQLENKFERLLAPEAVAPYLRDCYQKSAWKDRDVLFIRSSPWMVVFDQDKAVQLVLIKGC